MEVRNDISLSQIIYNSFRIGGYNLLSEVYNPLEMFIESTDRNRTIMSAQSHMLGMYPPLNPLEESMVVC